MQLLIIDPDQGIQEYYKNTLESHFSGIQVDFASNCSEAERNLQSNDYDLLITESELDRPFFAFLDGVVRIGMPVIVVSRTDSERLAVESIRLGGPFRCSFLRAHVNFYCPFGLVAVHEIYKQMQTRTYTPLLSFAQLLWLCEL